MYYACYSHYDNCFCPSVSTFILKGKGRHVENHNRPIVTWNSDLINVITLRLLLLYGHHYMDFSIHIYYTLVD